MIPKNRPLTLLCSVREPDGWQIEIHQISRAGTAARSGFGFHLPHAPGAQDPDLGQTLRKFVSMIRADVIVHHGESGVFYAIDHSLVAHGMIPVDNEKVDSYPMLKRHLRITGIELDAGLEFVARINAIEESLIVEARRSALARMKILLQIHEGMLSRISQSIDALPDAHHRDWLDQLTQGERARLRTGHCPDTLPAGWTREDLTFARLALAKGRTVKFVASILGLPIAEIRTVCTDIAA